MGGRHSRSALRLPAPTLREQLAQEAARVMVEGGIDDFGLAKRKAAERFGVRSAGALPRNSQIQACLVERQRIFGPVGHAERLATLRRVAADIMEQLDAFRPRLVGAVLEGTATIHSAVELHAFADAPELVAATLQMRAESVRDCQRRYRFVRQEDAVQIPGFELVRNGADVQVLVFPERGSHHAPLSPVDQRPMRRASRGAVLALLQANA